MFGSMGYEFSTPFLCFAGQPMEQEPRPAWNNNSAFTNANVSSTTWLNFYGVISLANDGLQALDRGVQASATNGADNTRARAFAKFMQGVAHGYLALMWDKAVIIDEHADVDTLATPTYSPYPEVMAAAITMLKASIAISDTATFTLPNVGWIPGLDVHEQGSVAARAHVHRALRDVRRAHRDRARGRELGRRDRAGRRRASPRTSRRSVRRPDLSDTLQAGRGARAHGARRLHARRLLARRPVRLHRRLEELGRDAGRESRRVPDAHAGSAHHRRGESDGAGNVLRLRREHRVLQSDARHVSPDVLLLSRATAPARRSTTDRSSPSAAPRWTCSRPRRSFVSIAPPRRFRSSTRRASRTASCRRSTSTDRLTSPGCVPRKTTGACGGLWDALRYEKRIEGAGVDGQVAYWDARGWNTLAQNSFIQFPIPGRELEIQRQPIYTYGGGGRGQRADSDVGQVSGIRDAGEVLVGGGGEQASRRRGSRADGQIARRADRRRRRARAVGPTARVRPTGRGGRQLAHAAPGSHGHDHAGGSALRGASRRRSAHRSGASHVFSFTDSSTGRRCSRSPTSSAFRRSRARISSNAPATACWPGAAVCSESRIRASRRSKSPADEQLRVDRRSAAHRSSRKSARDATRSGFSPRAATRV